MKEDEEDKIMEVTDKRSSNKLISDLRKKLIANKPLVSKKQEMLDKVETRMFGAPLRESVIWLPAIEYAGKLYPKEKYKEVYEELLGLGHAVNLDIKIDGMYLEKKDANWKPKNNKHKKTYGIKGRKRK